MDGARNADGEHEAVSSLLSRTAETRTHDSLVWVPRPHVAFGRRDTVAEGYESAVRAAREHGLETAVRNAGGRAVAHTGATVAFAVAFPDGAKGGLRRRYDSVGTALADALGSLGVETRRRGDDASFCPGDYSLWSSAGKVAGVAQRVRRDAALVSGVVVVDGHDEIRRVLDDVYGELRLDFDPSTVGSVSLSGGVAEPREVADAVEDALEDAEI